MPHPLDAAVAAFVTAAAANAPGVARWLEQAGVPPHAIRNVTDLTQVPVLSKDQMIELQAADPPFGGFLGVPLAAVNRIFLSPGPLLEPHGAETTWQATGAQVIRQAGFGPDQVVLNALGYHLSPGGFLLDGILAAAGCTVIPAGVGSADLQLKLLVNLGVTGYAGTPSWLMTLLQKAEEQGIPRAQVKVRRALLTAEPLLPALRHTFVNEYGLTVVNAYATGELGVLAYDLAGSPALRLVDAPLIQLVDRDSGLEVGPGEVGEIVVTNLNPTYPLVRFGTGDLAVNLDPTPEQSSRGERLIRLVGRVGDAVKVRGLFVHPNQLRAVVHAFGIQEFKAVVRRPGVRDELALYVVLPAEQSPAEIDAPLRAAFRETCRVNLAELFFVATIGERAGAIVDERNWE